jgi:hypothetical protein
VKAEVEAGDRIPSLRRSAISPDVSLCDADGLAVTCAVMAPPVSLFFAALEARLTVRPGRNEQPACLAMKEPSYLEGVFLKLTSL